MNDLLAVVDSSGRPNILVVGDIILDQYTWGDAERVSPEAPVLVLKVDTQEARLGGAASVAGLLRALDADVTLAGVIGDDASGRVVSRLLDEAGVDSSLVHCDAPRPTTTKSRLIGRADGKNPHHLLRVDEEWGVLLAEDVQQRLADAILDRLTEFDAVLISDYAKGVCRSSNSRTTFRYEWHEPSRSCGEGSYSCVIDKEPDETVLLQTVIQAANERGIPVLVDPARIPECECYRGATLLKPNRVEAELATGFKIQTPDAAMRASELLCEKLGLQAAVITLDRNGMALSRRGAPSELFPTTPRAVCDITGAGDMAFAMLGLVIASSAEGSPEKLLAAIPDAVRLANIASGLEVERLGVAPVHRGEIRTAIQQSTGAPPCKLTTLDQMRSIAQSHRKDGKTVVFTNGCFDLLHVGHVTMLEESARLGDVMIVAINSDASVRRLKGDGRPVIAEQERARLLAALGCVDHVLIFDDATPHQLLEAIHPDVLVKGGTTREIVGREVVEAYGGQVRLTGEIPKTSTSSLLMKIQSCTPSQPTTLPNTQEVS